MDLFGIFLIIEIIIVVTIIASAIVSSKLVVTQDLKKENKVSIKNFEDGATGKIVGQVSRYKKILKSPLSGRKCVFYQIYVQQKNNSNWNTVIREFKCTDFLLNEDGYKALIKVEDIKGFLHKDIEWNSGISKPATPSLIKYLNQRNLDSFSIFGIDKTMRFYEGIIHIGETVAVKGTGKWEIKSNSSEQKIIMRGNIVSDVKNTFN